MNVTPNFKVPKVKRTRTSYARVRELLAQRSEGRCEARFSEQCEGRGVEAHHVVRRSQGGTDDLENLRFCCTCCHAEIHANPRRAKAVGLLRSAA